MVNSTDTRTDVQQGLNIAQAEWTRHRREFGSLLTGRPAVLIVLVGIASVLGWFGYSLGRDFTGGQPLPTDALSLCVSAAFIWMVWRSSKYTHVRFKRLNPNILLTTGPARTAVLGLLGFVYVRLLTTLVVPTFGVAVGTAIGFRSPTVALTVALATVCIAVLAAVLGTTSRLAARLVGLRLVRVRSYRDLLIVFGWIPLIAAAMLLQELSFSLAPLAGLFSALPLVWFLDLVWEHDATGSTGTRGSHSLLKTGVVERLVGERIPRAMYTVARERWLMERRVPQGLLSTGYAILVMSVVGFPLIALTGSTTSLLVFFSVTLGLITGIAFTSDPIGTEYRTLPMLFTSVTGRQFVGGSLLAAAVVGIPLVVLIIVPLGIVAPVGFGQTVLIALLGIAVCTCTAAVTTMVGLGVERFNYAPVPFFFTDVPIYAEVGAAAFIRYGLVLAIGVFASIPAFVGTTPPVYEAITPHWVPTVVIQISALLLTLLLAAVITRAAFKASVQRFRDYQLG